MLFFTWTVTFIGIALCFWVGEAKMHLTVGQVLAAIAVSQFAAFFGLIVTIRAEKIRWLKQSVLNGALMTWGLLFITYTAFLWAFVPALRSVGVYAALFFPLFMADGIGIQAFGPVQDWFVARDQRRAAKSR